MTEHIRYSAPDGLRLYAKATGPKDAPVTAICIHGLTRNHKDFDPMIAALGNQHRFISMDVRGRGQSDRDPNPENYTPAVYAGDVIALMDHLGLEKTCLIGTSMGGLISMVLMKAAPERISGVVLNDVGPELDKKGLNRIKSYVGDVVPVADWESAANRIESIQNVAFPDATEKDWLNFARRTYREGDDGQLHLDYDPAIMSAVAAAKPGLLVNIAMWRLYGKMKSVPVLLLRGEISDLLSAKTAERMVRRHPAARLVTVPRVGHAPLLDEPASLDAINAFLAELGEAR